MKISREVKVGFLFLITIALLIWGYNFLKGKNVFGKERIFYAVYEHIDGLTKANDISIHGFKIGQVQDVYFDPSNSGKIIVELAVTNDFPIPRNSVARIFSSGLMGSKEVEIGIGSSPELAQSGDTLLSSIEGSLKDEVNRQVQPLKRKAEDLMSSIDSMVTIFQTIFNNNARDNLANSFEDIRKTFYNLQHSSSRMDTLITYEAGRLSLIIDHVESISRNLNDNEENITNILTNFSSLSDSLAKADVAGTFLSVNQSMNDLKQIMDKISKGEGTVGKLLQNDSLYFQLEKSASDLNLLLEDIKLHPKRYVRISLF